MGGAKKRHGVAIAIGAASVAALALVTCAVYDPSLLLPSRALDASQDAGEDAIAVSDAQTTDGGADTCVHARVPPKPTTEDGTDDRDVVMAAAYLRFFGNGTASVAHPSPPRGFDLDDTCTCPGPESCTPMLAQSHCDGEGGTDDSAGAILASFAAVAPDRFGDDALNSNITSGHTSILLRIKSWNGGMNDKQITAIVYASNGLDGVQDGGAIAPPKLDGTDVWTIDPGSLLGGATVDGGSTCEGNDSFCIPIFTDPEAYVSNGVFVAHLDFPIAVGSGIAQLVVRLSSTVLSGPLVTTEAGVGIQEGQVAGRWNTDGFLTALASVRDPLSQGGYLCGDSGTYLNIKNLACRGSDVTTDPTLDGMNAPCDALSIGLSFASVSAHLGPIYATAPKPAPCGASYKDDCTAVK